MADSASGLLWTCTGDLTCSTHVAPDDLPVLGCSALPDVLFAHTETALWRLEGNALVSVAESLPVPSGLPVDKTSRTHRLSPERLMGWGSDLILSDVNVWSATTIDGASVMDAGVGVVLRNSATVTHHRIWEDVACAVDVPATARPTVVAAGGASTFVVDTEVGSEAGIATCTFTVSAGGADLVTGACGSATRVAPMIDGAVLRGFDVFAERVYAALEIAEAGEPLSVIVRAPVPPGR